MGTKKENWKGEKRVNIEYNTEGTVEELSLKFKHSKKLSELNKQFFWLLWVISWENIVTDSMPA